MTNVSINQLLELQKVDTESLEIIKDSIEHILRSRRDSARPSRPFFTEGKVFLTNSGNDWEACLTLSSENNNKFDALFFDCLEPGLYTPFVEVVDSQGSYINLWEEITDLIKLDEMKSVLFSSLEFHLGEIEKNISEQQEYLQRMLNIETKVLNLFNSI